MAIKARARLTFVSDDNLPGAFGQGIALLMDGVEEEHSLNRAAKRMGMAYSKAWRIIKETEAALGFQLLNRDGAHGSTLTDEGNTILDAYIDIDAKLQKEAAKLFSKAVG